VKCLLLYGDFNSNREMPTNFSRASGGNIPLKYVHHHSNSFVRMRGQTDGWEVFFFQSYRASWYYQSFITNWCI